MYFIKKRLDNLYVSKMLEEKQEKSTNFLNAMSTSVKMHRKIYLVTRYYYQLKHPTSDSIAESVIFWLRVVK